MQEPKPHYRIDQHGAHFASPGPSPTRAANSDVVQVFEQSWGVVFRVMNRLTGDADVAKDLSQQAFVRLMERRTLPDDPEAWVITVANNLRRDHERKRSRRVRLLEVAGIPKLPFGDASETTDAQVIREETRATVRAALDELSPKLREVLVLRAEGYAYREIAQVVGVAPASVGQMLLRARAALIQALQR